jgi:hypothetical protein
MTNISGGFRRRKEEEHMHDRQCLFRYPTLSDTVCETAVDAQAGFCMCKDLQRKEQQSIGRPDALFAFQKIAAENSSSKQGIGAFGRSLKMMNSFLVPLRAGEGERAFDKRHVFFFWFDLEGAGRRKDIPW